MVLLKKKTYCQHAKVLATVLEAVLPMAKYHSAGGKLQLLNARRVLSEFKDKNRK